MLSLFVVPAAINDLCLDPLFIRSCKDFIFSLLLIIMYTNVLKTGEYFFKGPPLLMYYFVSVNYYL